MTFGGSTSVGGNIRTFLVFLDLPVHYEYRAPDLPVLTKGLVVEFYLTLKDPRTSHSRLVEGPYEVTRCKLVYRTDKPSLTGLTQYIELIRVL